jgi:hypothetical protein
MEGQLILLPSPTVKNNFHNKVASTVFTSSSSEEKEEE